jgi:hypothetical protein
MTRQKAHERVKLSSPRRALRGHVVESLVWAAAAAIGEMQFGLGQLHQSFFYM